MTISVSSVTFSQNDSKLLIGSKHDSRIIENGGAVHILEPGYTTYTAGIDKR